MPFGYKKEKVIETEQCSCELILGIINMVWEWHHIWWVVLASLLSESFSVPGTSNIYGWSNMLSGICLLNVQEHTHTYRPHIQTISQEYSTNPLETHYCHAISPVLGTEDKFTRLIPVLSFNDPERKKASSPHLYIYSHYIRHVKNPGGGGDRSETRLRNPSVSAPT